LKEIPLVLLQTKEDERDQTSHLEIKHVDEEAEKRPP
jgi:hypothetical protein